MLMRASPGLCDRWAATRYSQSGTNQDREATEQDRGSRRRAPRLPWPGPGAIGSATLSVRHATASGVRVRQHRWRAGEDYQMGLLYIAIAPVLAACVFGLLLLVNVLLRPSSDSTFVLVQRLSEDVLGLCASFLGLAILFSLLVLPSIGFVYDYFAYTPGRSWLPAVLAYVAALVAIGLGVVLHGLLSFARMSRRTQVLCAWAGRFLLWIGSAGLLVLVTLSGFSIGLLFLPSLYLALIACALALIPRPSRASAR